MSNGKAAFPLRSCEAANVANFVTTPAALVHHELGALVLQQCRLTFAHGTLPRFGVALHRVACRLAMAALIVTHQLVRAGHVYFQSE